MRFGWSYAVMDAGRVPIPIRPVPARSNLFSRSPRYASRSRTLIVAATVIVSAAIFYLLVVNGGHNRGRGASTKQRYGIVIDAGSTGTRIHVFGFAVGENGAAVFDFGTDSLGTMRLNPGLSSYAEDPDPDAAGWSLLELLEFARAKVPRLHWGETEIRLMATAGLRLLELGVQERLLNSCRTVLRSSGFRFQDNWASVIPGSDEGIYAWVAANYALGTFGGDPQKTTGIIELGGASAQVTFVSSEPLPSQYSHTLKFRNSTYHLYSHSFLHFGQNVAFKSLQESIFSGEINFSNGSIQNSMSIDPCTPNGYSHDMEALKISPDSLAQRNSSFTLHARGNYSECRYAAQKLLEKEKERCSDQRCDPDSIFTPKLHGKFLATENFFFTSKFFGLTSRASLSDLMMAGQEFCDEDWSKLKSKYHSYNDEDLQRYCFSSAYIVALLHDSLGIGLDDERIEFSNQVGNIPLDWAFGAFILHSMIGREHPDGIVTILNDESSTLLSVILFCIILMFIAWFIFKWKKPQLKTIYDLEKGRYIVTRINRS